MGKRLFGLLAVAVFAAPTMAQSDPKAVIEKAITAHGGKELLEKYPASKSKFKGEMSMMGLDMTFEGTSATGPGQFRLDLALDVMGQKLSVTQIVDNGKVKIKTMIGGQELPQQGGDAEIEELKFSTTAQEMTQFVPLLTNTKKYSLKGEKDDEVDGKKVACVVVTVKLDEKGEKTKDVKLFFDKESGLLVKTSRKGLAPGDPDGKEANQESILSDYKKVDGLMIAMKTTNFINGTKFMTITQSEHKNLEKLDKKDVTADD